nr:(d)CMP kinase [Bordetella genomosp. 11]
MTQADDTTRDTVAAPPPVIAIDGPTASGKGTVAHGVARRLGWTVLDSGALYRLTALSALEQGIAPEDEAAVAEAARTLPVRFDGPHIYLDGREVGYDIRQERVGNFASRVAAFGSVRQALLDRQRAFRRAPGLVADGRDMGTVVFPDAALKVFLVADVEARAERRRKQLMEKGISANLEDLLRDMRERDARDTQRSVAPLAPAADAKVLDSSKMTAQETVQAILDLWNGPRGGALKPGAAGTAGKAKGFSGAAGNIAPR